MKKFGPNDYRVVGDVVYIELTDMTGDVVAEALISLCDLELVIGLGRWSIRRDDHNNYAVRASHENGRNSKATYVTMHQHILGKHKDMHIDHINYNGLDNRRENIRVVTQGENIRRARWKVGNTGYRNVVKVGNRYRVLIKFNHKAHYLCGFKTAEEASVAAEELRAKLGA